MYPFTNEQIIQMIRKKQTDFKQGTKFNAIKKKLQKEKEQTQKELINSYFAS